MIIQNEKAATLAGLAQVLFAQGSVSQAVAKVESFMENVAANRELAAEWRQNT